MIIIDYCFPSIIDYCFLSMIDRIDSIFDYYRFFNRTDSMFDFYRFLLLLHSATFQRCVATTFRFLLNFFRTAFLKGGLSVHFTVSIPAFHGLLFLCFRCVATTFCVSTFDEEGAVDWFANSFGLPLVSFCLA